eukprot:256399-Alexandrium_andersonii.AAC.1
MSASLVGSEMCIRDSLHARSAAGRSWKPQVLEPGRAATAAARAGRPDRLVPVSYTHLRAHETSAHL